MPTFQDADAAFAAGAPFLQLLKPPLPLFFFALFARSPVRGDRDSFHTHLLCRSFIGGGEEPRIGREGIGRLTKLLNMLLQRGDQQGRVGGTFL